MCDVCGEREAVESCRTCGSHICRACLSVGVNRTNREEIEVAPFCKHCAKTAMIRECEGEVAVFGLERVTDMVNQDQVRMPRFKIKLKP